jgi:hypoxanthine phosphoribosyltransferase
VTYDDQDIMTKDPLIDRVLISSEDIGRRVQQLGAEISRDYVDRTPILVNILKGAYVFLADLTRCISVHHEVDFMAISSYHGGTESTGVVKIEKDLKANITDRDILIVEDIVDTGLTLDHLLAVLKTRNPRSIRVCTLLDKSTRRLKEVPVDYRGFDIPDEFVIGYGLDYDEKYRNMPFIGVLKP